MSEENSEGGRYRNLETNKQWTIKTTNGINGINIICCSICPGTAERNQTFEQTDVIEHKRKNKTKTRHTNNKQRNCQQQSITGDQAHITESWTSEALRGRKNIRKVNNTNSNIRHCSCLFVWREQTDVWAKNRKSNKSGEKTTDLLIKRSKQ